MTERPKDLAFEALAEATSTDWNVGRGELNTALRDIRGMMVGLDDTELATEILHRAMLYRRMYPDIALTPTALSKHWIRVLSAQRSSGATNQSTAVTECQTCDGHRFVVVSTRPAEQTMWMTERGLKATGEIEEYALCPDCSSHVKVGARVPDPAKVREMMRS